MDLQGKPFFVTLKLMDKALVFVGISVSTTGNTYALAALDNEKNILALNLANIMDVLAYTSGLGQACVAICAPQTTAHISQENPKKLLRKAFRSADQTLLQHGIAVIPLGNTPKTCPAWVRHGLDLYTRLKEINYSMKTGENSPRQLIETHSEAVFIALLGKLPYPAESFEGRMQRQLILQEQEIPVPDPMSFIEEITRFKLLQGNLPIEKIYSQGELAALAGALTAWQFIHEQELLVTLGTEQDGFVFVPVLPAIIEPDHQMSLPDIYPFPPATF